MNKNKILAATIALLCSVSANADTTMRYTTTDNSQQPGVIYVTDDQLRADNVGESQWVLYERQSNRLFFVDDSKQQYFIFDEQQIQSLSNSLGQVSQQLDDALADLPPAQRAQAQALMQSMLSQSSGAFEQIKETTEIRRTGRNDEVAGVDCEWVDVSVNEQLESQLCLAEHNALDLNGSETATVRAMADFGQQLIDTVQDSLGGILPVDFSAGTSDIVQSLKRGIPVKMIQNDSASQDVASLTSIDHNTIDSSLLQIPDHYKQEQMDLDF